MRTYRHLSLEERERIFAFRQSGLKISEIGRRLKRNKGTIYRELDRHTKYGKEYVPCLADRQAKRVGERQRRRAPLKSSTVFLYVRKHLREDRWSPEQIAGRLPIDHPEESVHLETIYRYIYSPRMKRFNYRKYLTIKRKKRMKKLGRKVKRSGKIPNAQSIDLRSKVVAKRKQPGHWESDNMEGKKSDKTVASVTVERLARYTKLVKLKDRKSPTKVATVVKQINTFPPALKGTMTEDNGAENTNHEEFTKETNMPVFFCHSYHSWEKGTVENTVGRIRKFVPKGTSLDTVSDEEIRSIEERMNNTPRKCLNFMTPNEKMAQILEKERKKGTT